MDLLFRPVFARVKTPVIGSLPERQSSASTDDNNEPEEILTMNTRVRTTPRVSSYMGFRPATPPIPAPDSFLSFRDPENVYHKPSGDQLAEMLKVVMMNQGSMDCVPKQYNSTILHVLEAYQDLRMQLNAKEEAIEILKHGHTKDIKEFEDLAAQWHRKESDYKSEMKKLEVLLSKTEGGMESVTLARSNSVVHGAEKASDSIKRGIGTIKNRNSGRNSHEAGIIPPNFEQVHKNMRPRRSFRVRDDRDSIASASFEYRRLPQKRNAIGSQPPEQIHSTAGSLHLWDSPDVLTTRASLQVSEHLIQPLTMSQLEALQRQQAKEFGINFESSVSGVDSSDASHRSEIPAHRTPPLGLGILEKPLPDIPFSTDERGRQTTLDQYLDARQHSSSDPNTNTSTPVKKLVNYELGFSFIPGDDGDIITKSTERDRIQRKNVDERLSQRPSLPDLRSSASYTPISSIKTASRRPRLSDLQNAKNKPSPKLSPKPSQLPRPYDHDILGRMDSSSSSIVTAVRDNSGRSSANNSQAGRPNLRRSTEHTSSGSNDAVSAATAAARAYAAKRSSDESVRKGSGSRELRREVKSFESERNKVVDRKISITSSDSITSGSEIDKSKKILGGMRMVEEP